MPINYRWFPTRPAQRARLEAALNKLTSLEEDTDEIIDSRPQDVRLRELEEMKYRLVSEISERRQSLEIVNEKIKRILNETSG